MLTGVYQSAATLAVAAAYYAMDFALIAGFDRRRRGQGSGRSWGYTLMALAAVAFIVAQPTVFPGLGLRTRAAWGLGMQVAGAALLAAGLGLHVWARLHLKQFYAERVEVQPDHQIVDSGPYARVRHPVFTSFFLSVTGLVLVNPSLPTGLIAVYAFWDFRRAAKQEEALLSRRLQGYADYMRRTSRFFPRLRRIPRV